MGSVGYQRMLDDILSVWIEWLPMLFGDGDKRNRGCFIVASAVFVVLLLLYIAFLFIR